MRCAVVCGLEVTIAISLSTSRFTSVDFRRSDARESPRSPTKHIFLIVLRVFHQGFTIGTPARWDVRIMHQCKVRRRASFPVSAATTPRCYSFLRPPLINATTTNASGSSATRREKNVKLRRRNFSMFRQALAFLARRLAISCAPSVRQKAARTLVCRIS